MKKSTLILLVICILIAVGAGYVWYQYNRKPADVKTEAAQVNTTATNLVTAFNDNEDSATQKYVGKIVSVSGKITDINVDTTGAATVFLESGDLMSAVTCSFYDTESAAVKKLSVGQDVTIKGVCTGKLIDVVFNKCSIVH